MKKLELNQPIDSLLRELDACKEACEWAAGKTWQEIYDTCHRGDWLMWLANKLDCFTLQQITLVKGHQANTVRHLMTDKRSTDAIDVAIKFGNGEATIEELINAAAYAVYAADAAAAYAADATAAYAAAAYTSAAAYAADAADSYAAAAYAADAAAYAADAADAYAAAAYAADAASDAVATRKANRKLTADIVRQYLPIELWEYKR